jgi:sodium transport system permease protein
VIRIHFDASRDASQAGRRRMAELLSRARTLGQEAMLERGGFPIKPSNVARVTEVSVATPSQVTGLWIGRFLTVFLVMFMLAGGSVVAMDIIAGEKERGSLETLLTTAARRIEIVVAKQLAILAVALLITMIQVANTLVYLSLRVIKLPWDAVIDVPPAAIAALFVLFIPVAAFVASVLLMISAHAKSYKEAQMYFFPVYLCSLVPALASVLPGVPLRSAIALVPIANVSVAVREIMVGEFDWPMIGVAFLAMAAAAGWTLRASTHMLSRERLITASESDAADFEGGADLFSKHVLRWYAVMGAVLFAVAANVPALATFRRQLLFNEIGLFFVGPLLMIARYRLDPRQALALRLPRFGVWPAVAMLIPAGNIMGIGVFRLANEVVPVPRQALEQFSRSVLPDDIPLWQLFVFVAVLPGIFEEIAFRGTLLYGLKHRFRPSVLVLVVGLIFGLFHVQLFRLAPTAFMGVVLTVVALLTGSILPGMLAHAGNNAFALWAATEGIPLASLEPRMYAGAAVVFALAMYLIYRNRSPYPDLRYRRP